MENVTAAVFYCDIKHERLPRSLVSPVYNTGDRTGFFMMLFFFGIPLSRCFSILIKKA